MLTRVDKESEFEFISLLGLQPVQLAAVWSDVVVYRDDENTKPSSVKLTKVNKMITWTHRESCMTKF